MYLEHYGLQHLPFQITPDVRFFFESQGHSRARATIIYGLSKNEGFVVVTGAVGAGKTTLLEHLLAAGRFEDAVVARINTTQLGAENLLELIAYRLGLPQIAPTKAGLLRDLESFLLATRAAGRRTLLIVDEVQNLSPQSLEELRMLSNFQDAENPLLQTLLVGQPEFRQRLGQPDTEQIRQRVIASYHLAPLALEDVPAYIAFRLKHAGYAGYPLFTPDALAEIATETGGVPRKINRLCDRALLYGYLEDRHELDGPALADVIQEMRAESLEAAAPAPAPEQAATTGSAVQRIRHAADELAGAALEPLELVDMVEPDAIEPDAIGPAASPAQAPAPGPAADADVPHPERSAAPAAPAATVAGEPASPGRAEPGPRRPSVSGKPVLIAMNGRRHAAPAPAPAPEPGEPQSGRQAKSASVADPPASPAPDTAVQSPAADGARNGVPDRAEAAASAGDGRVRSGDPAELSRTVAALRAELADYKSKIARIVDVLCRDGAPDGGPDAAKRERQ